MGKHERKPNSLRFCSELSGHLAKYLGYGKNLMAEYGFEYVESRDKWVRTPGVKIGEIAGAN